MQIICPGRSKSSKSFSHKISHKTWKYNFFSIRQQADAEVSLDSFSLFCLTFHLRWICLLSGGITLVNVELPSRDVIGCTSSLRVAGGEEGINLRIVANLARNQAQQNQKMITT